MRQTRFSNTHSLLIDALYNRILPMGVELMTPAKPTWARGDQRSCLDHVYTTSPGKLSPVAVIWTGMSDHALVKFGRFCKTIQSGQSYVKKRIFKNFDNNEFKQRVAEMQELVDIQLCEDVEVAATLLTEGLTKVLDEMAPIKTIQTRNNYAPHMGEETKLLQGMRNSAQEQAVRSGEQEDWRTYRTLRNQTTASLRRDLVNYRRQKLCSQDNSPADVWRAVKQILNWEGGGPPSQLFYEGRMLTRPAAVAGAINGFFIKKVKDIIRNVPHVNADPLEKLRERMSGRTCSLTFQPVNVEEVINTIRAIRPDSLSSTWKRTPYYTLTSMEVELDTAQQLHLSKCIISGWKTWKMGRLWL